MANNINDGDNFQDMQPSTKLSKADVIVGGVILISAQFFAASTASCVHALPEETPSVLRGLWRQTLTSIIFFLLASIHYILEKHNQDQGKDSGNRSKKVTEQRHDISPHNKEVIDVKGNDGDGKGSRLGQLSLVALAVLGATLLNDSIVIALEFASSAAVMCLCNTTPIWLILFAIVHCGTENPRAVTIFGASISLIGAIICSTAGLEKEDLQMHQDLMPGQLVAIGHKNESLGAIIATLGGIGGAIYMTSCRKLAPVGMHPIVLTLIINVGMMIASFILCLASLPNGISIFSMDLSMGFFGFLNPNANPAALLHSLFPDCGGNFGIMLALRYFEPLIVSMVMLTEPLNASLIAMNFVNEPPPSQRTIFGVAVVLVGCGIVLWQSNKEEQEMAIAMEQEEILDVLGVDNERCTSLPRTNSSLILFSPVAKIAPEVSAKAAFYKPKSTNIYSTRFSLPPQVERLISLGEESRKESDDIETIKNSCRSFTSSPDFLDLLEKCEVDESLIHTYVEDYGAVLDFEEKKS